MKQTQLIMGMPITVEVIDELPEELFEKVFDYFRQVDARFSTYKETSEISQLNRNIGPELQLSAEMREVLQLCEEYRQRTDGYFDMEHNGRLDPSGLVKGWAIKHAAKILQDSGVQNFYVEAGGDIQARGHNGDGTAWAVGIRSPKNVNENVKVIHIKDGAVATSGTYVRGQHIYNPKTGEPANEIASLTVIGVDILEVDCLATAAFAMGRGGIDFIEKQAGLEGYMVDNNGMATLTSGLSRYTA